MTNYAWRIVVAVFALGAVTPGCGGGGATAAVVAGRPAAVISGLASVGLLDTNGDGVETVALDGTDSHDAEDDAL